MVVPVFSKAQTEVFAAPTFQEGCTELAQQASGLAEDVTKLEAATIDGVSLQVWLSGF